MVDKVREEIDEVMDEALQVDVNQDKLELELGDLLFATVNLARHLQVNPESALSKANLKFTRRFQGVERKVAEQNKQLQQCSLQELDECWNQIKREENASE